MTHRKPPIPTDAELALLKVLWAIGPGTVRQVHEALNPQTGYTTTLKQLQVMTEKGLVLRDERQRSHVYRAALEEEPVLRQLAGELLRRAFDGSAGKLLLHALPARHTSPRELAQIRALLDAIEKGGPGHDAD